MNSRGHQLFRLEVKRGQSQVTFGKSEHLVRLNSKGRKHEKIILTSFTTITENMNKIFVQGFFIRLNYELKACNFFLISNFQENQFTSSRSRKQTSHPFFMVRYVHHIASFLLFHLMFVLFLAI